MKKLILTALCLCLVSSLSAQTANDYFHSAANYYVNANKKSAQSTIQEGIIKYPNDSKLKTLATKINELPDPEDDQNQQNQQNQQNKDQDKQDQKDQDKQDQQNQQDQKDQKGEQPQQRQISPEDAQRILNALEQEEKDLQEKMQKKERAGSRPAIEKNW